MNPRFGNPQIDALRAELALKGGGGATGPTGPAGPAGAAGAAGATGPTGPGGQTANVFWTQATWFIDPRNRTGLASDSNDGLTALTPVLTWNGGVIKRYGTLTPILAQNTTWTFLSPTAVAETDPIVFSPIASNGAQLVFQGTLVPANKIGSGIIAGFIAKNYATAQLTAADLGSAGAVTTNMLVINTTGGKASAAWTFSLFAGTVFNLSQPLQRTTLPLSIPNFVDTWANGDTFDVYQVDAIELAQFTPTFADTASRAYIQQLGFESSAAGSPFYIGNGVAIQECRIDRRAAMLQSGTTRNTYTINSIFTDAYGINGGSTANNVRAVLVLSTPSQRIIGGFGSLNLQGAIIDGNFICTTGAAASSFSGGVLGTVYLAAGLIVQGATGLAAFFADGPRIWGVGQYNIDDGRNTLLGGTAVSTFINTAVPPILIGGLSTAFTSTKANPSVTNGNVAITPATIDANVDPVGVGMYAPGGGSIGNLF